MALVAYCSQLRIIVLGVHDKEWPFQNIIVGADTEADLETLQRVREFEISARLVLNVNGVPLQCFKPDGRCRERLVCVFRSIKKLWSISVTN